MANYEYVVVEVRGNVRLYPRIVYSNNWFRKRKVTFSVSFQFAPDSPLIVSCCQNRGWGRHNGFLQLTFIRQASLIAASTAIERWTRHYFALALFCKGKRRWRRTTLMREERKVRKYSIASRLEWEIKVHPHPGSSNNWLCPAYRRRFRNFRWWEFDGGRIWIWKSFASAVLQFDASSAAWWRCTAVDWLLSSVAAGRPPRTRKCQLKVIGEQVGEEMNSKFKSN